MKLFSEKVKHTSTNSSLNILQVENFEEIFFGVYEIEINKTKYLTEKISDYEGSPVVSVPVTVGGNKIFYPFVLSKGKQEICFNEFSEPLDVENIVIQHTPIEEVDLSPIVESAPAPEPIVDNRYKILEQIDRAKKKAKLDISLLKKKNLQELHEEADQKEQRLVQVLEDARQGMVEEFVDISKKLKNELVNSNDGRLVEIKETVDNKIQDLANSLDDALSDNFTNAIPIFESKLRDMVKEIHKSLTPKIDKQLENIAVQIVEKVSSIEKNLDTKLDTKAEIKLVEQVEAEVSAVQKANIELHNTINKGVQKALSRVGNVDTKVDKLTIALAEEVESKIQQAEENIILEYNNRIAMLEEKTFNLTEENKKYILDIVKESKNDLITELRKIKDEKPIEYVIESKGVKQTKDFDSIRKDWDKEISDKIGSAEARLRRYISVYSGGGSVAQQFASGGTMNGNLIVNGALISNNMTVGGTLSTNNLISLSATVGGNLNVGGNVTVVGTLSTNNLVALSARITVLDITQYELSGFRTIGDLTVNGGLSANTLYETVKTLEELSHKSLNYDLSSFNDTNYPSMSTMYRFVRESSRYSGAYILPTIVDNGNGTVSISAGYYSFAFDAEGHNPHKTYLIAANTYSMTDNAVNFVNANLNNGDPILQVATSNTSINNQTIYPVWVITRAGTQLDIVDLDHESLGLPNKITLRLARTRRIEPETGTLVIGTSSLGRVVTITAGRAWFSATSTAVSAYNSSQVPLRMFYHSGGNWVTTPILSTGFENQRYDDGTSLQNLTPNRFAVSYIYRNIGNNVNRGYMILGQGNYTLGQAQVASPPAPLPNELTNALFVGRIITERGATVATQVDSAFTAGISLAGVTDHNSLTNLQGGAVGDYNHLTTTELTYLQNLQTTLSCNDSTGISISSILFRNNITGSTTNGGLWFDGGEFKIRKGGVTYTVATSGSGSSSSSLVNFTESLNNTSPNASIPVVGLSANNSNSNIDVALCPKGVGGISANIANNLITGGNKRGNYAIDWQCIRTVASQVASGQSALIGGGESNMASGQNSIVLGGNNNTSNQTNAVVLGGSSNTASGSASLAFGLNNVASGSNSTALGVLNVASGDYSIASGLRSTTRGINGAFCRSAGFFTAVGDAQFSNYIIRVATTDATQTELTSNGLAPTASTRIVLPNNSSYSFQGQVIGRSDVTGNTASWRISGTIKRGASAATTSIVGSVLMTDTNADAGASTWLLSVDADTTNGNLRIRVTGAAATNINWVAVINTCEVVF